MTHPDPVQSRMAVPDAALLALLGSRDQNLRTAEDMLAADVHVRGNELTLTGAPADVAFAERVFTELHGSPFRTTLRWIRMTRAQELLRTDMPIADIARLVQQNVSMMPEGLEGTMTEQEFADLVAFLLTREPPAPASAPGPAGK